MKNPHISEDLYFGLELSTLAMSQFKDYDPNTIFGFTEPVESFINYIKSKLRLQKITNLKEAKDMLFFYANDKMYNNLFSKLRAQINLMTLSEYQEHLEGVENPIDYKRYQLVKTYQFDLGRQGIKAYDVSEYVKLTRLCGLCGLLSENEVRNRIWDIAIITKKWFTSWNDFHKAVMIGEQFAEAYGHQNHNILAPEVRSHNLWYKLSNEAKLEHSPFLGQQLFSDGIVNH
ncbi:DUF1266 domain-containing protein [Marivirga tractuosa]|uniref:DUF1266 domain-containing protein n=1 Tax=Marivirga tractuosa TaxID=1006 RepID=UPI0035CEA043